MTNKHLKQKTFNLVNHKRSGTKLEYRIILFPEGDKFITVLTLENKGTWKDKFGVRTNMLEKFETQSESEGFLLAQKALFDHSNSTY